MSKASLLPPGPTEAKYKQAMKMGLGIYEYLSECHKKFGDAFTLNLPGMAPMVWVASPEMAKSFFNLKPEELDQSKLPIPIDVGDNQTGFINNKEHMDSRKIMIPPLVAKRLQDRAEVMHEITTRYINKMKPGDEYDMPRLIGDITLDIACYTLLGVKEGPKQQRYRQLMLDWIVASTNDTMFLIGNLYGPQKFRNMLHKAYLKKTAKGDFG
ncbi:MAG TPA: cytochrome P450, partial [Pseudomonadales bacterium]|nr:cytochrome P450 [Pseudomonadales bacterium]